MILPVLPRPVSLAGRLLDLAAAVLIALGGMLYAYAYLGLERMRSAPDIAFTPGMVISQLAMHNSLARISFVGLALIALGVACAVYAWRQERVRRSART